jgi:hypothetical protein
MKKTKKIVKISGVILMVVILLVPGITVVIASLPCTGTDDVELYIPNRARQITVHVVNNGDEPVVADYSVSWRYLFRPKLNDQGNETFEIGPNSECYSSGFYSRTCNNIQVTLSAGGKTLTATGFSILGYVIFYKRVLTGN